VVEGVEGGCGSERERVRELGFAAHFVYILELVMGCVG
jgi:hypothetical protein